MPKPSKTLYGSYMVIGAIILTICSSSFPVAAENSALPSCEEIRKQLKSETSEFYPTMFHEKLPVLAFTNPVGQIPETPGEGESIHVYADFPLFLWSEMIPFGEPQVFLYWESNSQPGVFEKVQMKKNVETVTCRYKGDFMLFFKRRKTGKMQTKIRFSATIPSHPRGTTITYFVKTSFFTQAPAFDRSGLSALLLSQKQFVGNALTIPPLQGAWNDAATWEQSPLLNTYAVTNSYHTMEKTQMAFDGQYLYFRIEASKKIKKNECRQEKSDPLTELLTHAVGVLLSTPEYKPVEAGHRYMLSGWVLVYAPCANHSAPGLAFIETSTVNKGLIENSGAEYTFLSENDLVMKLPYESLQPNPSKLLLATFLMAEISPEENKEQFFVQDAATHLYTLKKHSFTVK